MAIGQEEIGRRIKQAREDADLTQQELAERIGIGTAQSISRYERAKTEVSTKRLRRIAAATGKELDFFIQTPEQLAAQGEEIGAVLLGIDELRGEVRGLRQEIEDRLPPREDSSAAGTPA